MRSTQNPERGRARTVRALLQSMTHAIARAEDLRYADVVDALLLLKTSVARRASDELEAKRAVERVVRAKRVARRRKGPRSKPQSPARRHLRLV
jgi:hypothetical protein